MFFRKGLQPRKFHYEPWFWDPEKEEFEKRITDAKKKYHGEEDEEYRPGRSFDFKGTRNPAKIKKGYSSRYETNYGKINPLRLLTLIAILGGLVYFMFFW